VAFEESVEVVGKAVDGIGVAIVVLGAGGALALYLLRILRRRSDFVTHYRACREGVGRSILLGLELLVAGDIIRTVAISPTLGSLGVLAGIVLIRTFLSLSLEVELEGRLPWHRGSDRSVEPRT
jgi:uncharacterized membrane protein